MEKTIGTIIAAHGRHYLAQTDTIKLQCVTRGKKNRYRSRRYRQSSDDLA
jgi:hypothetical protein